MTDVQLVRRRFSRGMAVACSFWAAGIVCALLRWGSSSVDPLLALALVLCAAGMLVSSRAMSVASGGDGS